MGVSAFCNQTSIKTYLFKENHTVSRLIMDKKRIDGYLNLP